MKYINVVSITTPTPPTTNISRHIQHQITIRDSSSTGSSSGRTTTSGSSNSWKSCRSFSSSNNGNNNSSSNNIISIVRAYNDDGYSALLQQQQPHQQQQQIPQFVDGKDEGKKMQQIATSGHSESVSKKPISPQSTILDHPEPAAENMMNCHPPPLRLEGSTILQSSNDVYQFRITTQQEEKQKLESPTHMATTSPPTTNTLNTISNGNDVVGTSSMMMSRTRSLYSISTASSNSSGDSAFMSAQSNIKPHTNIIATSIPPASTVTEASSSSSQSHLPHRHDVELNNNSRDRHVQIRRNRENEESSIAFGRDLKRYTNGSPDIPKFDRGMREVMEPHLYTARYLRERTRHQYDSTMKLDETSVYPSSYGVPYTRLRSERRFLFDDHTYPIHEILAKTLGVEDLSQIHNYVQSAPECDDAAAMKQLMAPLLSRSGRKQFQESYDNFVTSFCIPLLHSFAMSANIFHHHRAIDEADTNYQNSNAISYRYQAFPSIRIQRPGDKGSSTAPHSDSGNGHSIGSLVFHIPLTPAFGTNAVYTESHPGKEDWHPLNAKSVGLGYLFDGARCLSFNMENTTNVTCVSLDFRIAIHRGERNANGTLTSSSYGDVETITTSSSTTSSNTVGGNGLCSKEILEDDFSRAGPGYYDEAVIDISGSSSSTPYFQAVAKKYGHHLMDPDYRVGFPFS